LRSIGNEQWMPRNSERRQDLADGLADMAGIVICVVVRQKLEKQSIA